MRKTTHTAITQRGLTFSPVPSVLLQRKCACGNHTVTGRECTECTECTEKKHNLQRKASNQRESTDEIPPIVHEILNSPGHPLDSRTRAFMEPRLGHDFSQVRVHTDAKAAESARAVNALAYTVGRDVVFGAHQYRPEINIGHQLLAHELAHVVQQGATTQSPLQLGEVQSATELEADAVAHSVVSDKYSRLVAHMATNTLQRQGTEENERRRRQPEARAPNFQLQEPPIGQNLGLSQPRFGLGLPQLQIDPQIQAQIHAIQLIRSLISIENITKSIESLSGISLTTPTVPRLPSSLALPMAQPSAAQSSAALALKPPSLPQPAPLVPRGKGPETTEPADFGDLLKAVLKIPAVQSGLKDLQTVAEKQIHTTGERTLVITHGVILTGVALPGILANPERRQFLLDKVQGSTISIPGLPMTFQFNLTGPDQRLQMTLDVGALLPPQLGFKASD